LKNLNLNFVIKPTSIPILQPLVEKARAELAAKQPAPVVKQAAVVQKSVAKLASIAACVDYEDDAPSQAPPPPMAAAKDPKKTNGKQNGKVNIFVFYLFYVMSNVSNTYIKLLFVIFKYLISIWKFDYLRAEIIDNQSESLPVNQ